MEKCFGNADVIRKKVMQGQYCTNLNMIGFSAVDDCAKLETDCCVAYLARVDPNPGACKDNTFVFTHYDDRMPMCTAPPYSFMVEKPKTIQIKGKQMYNLEPCEEEDWCAKQVKKGRNCMSECQNCAQKCPKDATYGFSAVYSKCIAKCAR
jgi:hypothetical protein